MEIPGAEETEQKIIQLYKDGYSRKVISSKTSCSEYKIKKILDSNKLIERDEKGKIIKNPSGRKKYCYADEISLIDVDKKEEIMKYYLDHTHSAKWISAKMSIRKCIVEQIIKDSGKTRPKRGEK